MPEKETPINEISDKDKEIIEFLTSSLADEDGRCALVLGPDFFTGENTDLANYIKSSSNIFYLPGDGLMYFKKDINPREESTQYKEIINFLNSKKQADVHADLARLPFSFIISLSPVDFLLDAYNDIGKDYYFYYYKNEFVTPDKLKNNYPPIEKLDTTESGNERNLIADKNKPLILNMLGHYSDTQSLVYTHHALFEYLYSLPITKIPDNIRFKIKDKIKCFLVLGVHFNKWYLKLIFFLLSKLASDKVSQTAIFSYDDKDAAESAEINFYKTYFQIEFLKMSDQEFIKALLNNINQDALFKTTVTTKEQQIKNCFLKADYLHCLNLSIDFYGDEKGEFALLISRLNDNELQWKNNSILPAEYNMEKTKIKDLMLLEIPCLSNKINND